MEKILVELFVPAVGQTYDVFIPRNSKIHEVLFLMSETVKELAGGRYLPAQDTTLCDDQGRILNINMSVSEHGIVNGSKLMLI